MRTDRSRYAMLVMEVNHIARETKFDREKALSQAMLVFWKKGYEAASVPDLLQAMGLSRSSLYNTFGDKRSLFLEAIRLYQQQTAFRQQILNNATSAKAGIAEYFRQRIDAAYSENRPKGCLITNTAIEMNTPDEELKKLIKERFTSLEASFCRLLAKGRQSGEIKDTADIRALACLLLNLNHSINIMAKVNMERQQIEQMVQTVMNSF